MRMGRIPTRWRISAAAEYRRTGAGAGRWSASSCALTDRLLDLTEVMAQQPLLRRLAVRQRCGDPSPVEDDHPVAHVQQLEKVRRDEEHRRAVGGQPVQELVDLRLRPDVDALGRLIEQ